MRATTIKTAIIFAPFIFRCRPLTIVSQTALVRFTASVGTHNRGFGIAIYKTLANGGRMQNRTAVYEPSRPYLPGLGCHSMPGLVRCLAAYAFLGAQQRKGEALLAASLWVFSPKVGGSFPAYPPIRSLLYHTLCKPSTVIVIYFSWLKRTL